MRQHLTVARVAEGLGVAWDTANDAVLAEGRRVLIEDPGRLEGVTPIGVDELVSLLTLCEGKNSSEVSHLSLTPRVLPAWAVVPGVGQGVWSTCPAQSGATRVATCFSASQSGVALSDSSGHSSTTPVAHSAQRPVMSAKSARYRPTRTS